MRYDNWDVILFPAGRDSHIPFKEFKVACHVVPDFELAHLHGGTSLPLVTCFVPSLAPGAAFQVSIHWWRRPDVSQYTRTYSMHTDGADLSKLEARVMVDGRLVASTVLDREVNGPHLVTTSLEFTKTGERERLKFPDFRRELLRQDRWDPNDDIGRIKVIISEGFPRDSLSVPIERVKNVVAFSFQHAPLDILEANGIAWPNPSMWRCSSLNLNPAMPLQTYRQRGSPSSHTHTPGTESLPLRNISNQGFPPPVTANTVVHPQAGRGASLLGNHGFQGPYLGESNAGVGNTMSFADSFIDRYLNWAAPMSSGQPGDSWDGRTFWPVNPRNTARRSGTDTTMSDYVSSQASDHMHISGPSLEDDPMMSLRVPTNTPTTTSRNAAESAQCLLPQHVPAALHPDFASTLTQSLLNQPFPLPVPPHNLAFPASGPKTGKENHHVPLAHTDTDFTQHTSLVDGIEIFKLSQPIFGLAGHESRVPVPSPSETCVGNQENNRPTLPSTFPAASRNTSGDGCGANIANNQRSDEGLSTATAGAASQLESGPAGTPKPLPLTPIDGGSAKHNGNATAKWSRTYMPPSVRAIDEEDEPRLAARVC